MKKAVALLAILVLLAGIVVPSPAWAWRNGHWNGGSWHGGWHGGWSHGGWHHGWRGGCCWGRWWGPGVVVGGLAVGAAVGTAFAAGASYPYYYGGASYPYYYGEPPVAYQPAPAYAAPSAPAVQREVVYPNGRYVLYGDGMTQPWQWVWVPATPAAPPPPTQQ
jgi:hypothetical protein